MTNTWSNLANLAGSGPVARTWVTAAFDPTAELFFLFGRNDGSKLDDLWMAEFPYAERWMELVPGGGEVPEPQVGASIDSKKLYLAPVGSSHVRITGMAEFAGEDASVDRRRAELLVAQADALLPGTLDVSRAEYHAGLRPLSADDVPILGEVGPELFLNVGHGSKAGGWKGGLVPYALERFRPLRRWFRQRWRLPACGGELQLFQT